MGWSTSFIGKTGFTLIILVNCLVSCQSHNVLRLESGAIASSNSSLEYHLCSATDQLEDDTEMILSSGIHLINQGDPCFIVNISNLVIRGSGRNTEIRCTSNVIGRNFIFLSVTNLRIENVTIVNCGRTIPNNLPSYVNSSYIYFGVGQKGVILLSHVSNLVLKDVTIDRCFGFGIIGMNLDGITMLHRVVITNTDNFKHLLCIVPPSDFSCSGSGAVFLYSDPIEGEPLLSNSSLMVTNSTFERNENRIPLMHFVRIFSSVRSSYQTERLALSGGTGLAFYTLQRSYHVRVKISGSRLAYNDGYSPALVMVSYNMIREVSIRIDECHFVGNIARTESRGGGLILLQVNYIDALKDYPTYPDDVYEILRVTRSNFMENESTYGGAAYIHPTPQNVSDIRIIFDSVSFVGNIAQHGSAFASVAIQSTFVPKALHILLEDIVAENNTFPSVIYTTTSTLDSSGIFQFVTTQNVTFSGRESTGGSKFFNNNPGVILASGSNVYLKGKLEFYDNFAFRGGAIGMVDYSILFFHEGSRIHFSDNRVLSRGGAIYADTLGTLDACILQFIGPNRISSAAQVPMLDLNITFDKNMAGEAGNSIYANPVYECVYLPEASLYQSAFTVTPEEIYARIFNVIASVDNGVQELSSSPERLCFCNGTEFLKDFCGGALQTSVSLTPGEVLTLYVVPVDKSSNPVSSIMFAEFNTPELQLISSQNTQRLSGQRCDPVTFQVHGMENENGNLNLYAVLGGLAITVVVTLDTCPPGFSIGSQDGLLKCLCDTYVTNALSTTCNTSSYTIARPGNAWIGVIKHTNASDVVYVPTCPIDHCNERITYLDLRIPDEICEPGRIGVLCGACQPGLSIVFGSNECRECSNFWLLTIVFYAILGIMLVVILFILDLTVTQGTVVGLIFYANIVSVNINIFNHSQAQDFVFIFVSLINLELGFPLCFFNGMTELTKVGLQYVFPAYLLSLSVAIIYLIRWSSRMRKLTASNGIHVLATLLYLSYAKILRTVIDSLSLVTLRSEVQYHIIWLYDGNHEYFSREHIALVIVAILALLLFLTPYTLMLLFIKQFHRHCTVRLKPILDAYGGPYKDRYTFWVGLRLLTLAIMCSTYAIAGTDEPSLALMIQLIFVIFFLFWQAITKPFKNYFVELLDLFFTMNFIMMAIASLHLLNVQDLVTASTKQRALVEVLISLVFIAFCGIITFHVLKALHRIPSIGKKMDKFWIPVRNWMLSNTKMELIKETIHVVANPERSMTDGSVELKGMKSDPSSKTSTLQQTVVSLETAERAPDTSETDVRTRKLTKADFSQLREPALDT